MITFDNLMLKAFIEEQEKFLAGARINKIQQPTRKELILVLRNNGISKKLYINIDPKFYHICFISEANENKRIIEIPQKPPMFCMLLRKYLENSKIAKINQPENERICELFVETYNEIGDKIYLCLAIEMMGKHSNIILYNTDTNIIIGCAHNVGADKSQVREVYGQIPYTYPPKQKNNNFVPERYGFLLNYYKTTPENIYYSMYKDLDINNIFDCYYAKLINNVKFNTLKSECTTTILQRLKKCQKSLDEMLLQLKQSKNYDKFRLYGDLLMSNLYNLEDFSDNAKVFDYENNQNITIPLNITKTIKENANNYYKKYNKSKTAGIKLGELINEHKQNKKYLESILYSIKISQNIEELKEIEQEIIFNLPLIGKKVIGDKSNKTNIAESISCIEKPYQTRIYIGKNNKQNDFIISKLASEDDLWFHTKDCPGSHVLLKTQNITDDLILECAKLAKKYSSGSKSSKIGVIYTKSKYLRKPPKAHLGYVTYKNEKEIIID